MNITQRLILSYSLLITSLISLVIAAVLIMSGVQGRFQYVQEHAIPSIIDLGDMIDKSDSLIIWLYRHQSSTNKEKQMQIEKQINQTIENLRQSNLRYLKNSISNDRDRQLTENALNIIDTLRGKLPIFITGSIAQDDAITLRELQGNKGIGQAARDLIANYRVQLKHNMEYGENLERYNKRIYHLTFWSMIIAASAIVLILSVLTLRTILGIRNSLNAIRDTMARSSAALDLTRRVDDARNDEIGLTARAYNHLVSNVASSLAAVSMASQSVSTASSQISAGNEDLSSRTEEQAASLEETAASMSELTETVRQTAENTRIASELSTNARNISDNSTEKVATMLATMSDIRASSAKITDIISLIEGIAFQTNILALNAAVEAARAGEQGRGFAVVAGEVRNLAQRSSTSAREIKMLIESSMQFIQTGVEQAEDVGKNMRHMNDAVRQVTDLINEISGAAHEQMLGIGQINQAVNEMDSVTQQNASLVEEASAASASLMEQADVLNQLVSKFIIGGDLSETAPGVENEKSAAMV
ncbi:methyl-accepting chemotaxis protein [Pluralibacter gergoviae]|uniref:methyl-accepting chemotaxis protein n=1 Tax=Pluralibacter gergoviae TaxID=61647 RepID=UPI0006519B42|nr:methyl-accepting chemotaxis protein [Pluralibacter gergoviae]ELN2738281.1 methyl-accepting chemotaxis protein [Pluralibacter gergoviae]KMK33506.1 methyl-accepting chemotaxis protein [Pluralibacter gergoviae]